MKVIMADPEPPGFISTSQNIAYSRRKLGM